METPQSRLFLESSLYQNPQQAFDEMMSPFKDNDAVAAYLKQVLQSDDPKDDAHQEAIKPILEGLLAQEKKEEAGLLFNIHRTLTAFRGYGANDSASSDVTACFGDDVEIPERGVIVVDFFVTRNLPKILELCQAKGVDLGRIRVCAPKGVMAAQLMQMNDAKRAEFEKACSRLEEYQFLVEDVMHNADIVVDEEVAVWFSPRTMPITPRLHGETEEETAENYCEWFRQKVANVVEEGRIFANLAFSEMWQPLGVEVTEGKRILTKLIGTSRRVAEAISRLLIDELQFRQLGVDEFNPADVDRKIDHAKAAQGLHLINRMQE